MTNELPEIIIVQNQLGDLGGVSKFCDTLSRGLNSRGYQTKIFAVHSPTEAGSISYSPEIETALFTDEMPPGPEGFTGPGAANRLQKARRRFREAANLGAQQLFSRLDDNTIVIFTQLYAKEITLDLTNPEKRMGSYRVISQYHGSFDSARRGRDLHRAKNVFMEDDLFLLLTAEDANLFQKAGFNNTGFILNPLDREALEETLPLSDKVVVSLGRYNNQKSLDHLISAWSLLQNDFPDWELHLYGSGPTQEELSSQIQELELAHSVLLKGPTSDPLAVLMGSSINAQSSQFEGLPLALLEASLLGVPNVAYDCAPGIREIILDDETGFVVKQNSVTGLASALSDLMKDQKKRNYFGQASKQFVQEKFSLRRILDQWESIFTTVLR